MQRCNNYYQQKSEVLHIFTPSKYYEFILNFKPKKLTFLTHNTESYNITLTFTDQNGRPLKVEFKVNLTLLINKPE